MTPCSSPDGAGHRSSGNEEEIMRRVTSKDGTSIAFDRTGQGPALIALSGGPLDRSADAPVASLLAPSFTVYTYDRRGRGDSGDTAPYALDREFEDLEALIAEAGGSVYFYGSSGGGILGLEAAARGLGISRLALWEPPFIVDDSRPPVPDDYSARLAELLAEGRRGDMVELFMTEAVGMPADFVAPMRAMPFWQSMEKVAHTLIYDAALVGDFSLPAQRLASVAVPSLVIDGGQTPWLRNAAEAVARTLPNARRHTLDGQPHNVAPEAIAPVLAEFFGS
jgi:pimeloyl-ACP methyl ester carboxylesterase